ncbi:MAG: 16S rRNA (uracil(1498)-N(3))-methyltransferase [Flavobacteriaceae bacterium]|jgi:16S rRNA (uracil1498-N3)-methyltransferase|nr:16S rRNA (uracil(1498)-N(3))-methyltransferase [Flavobacteriaceae bacterium]
MHLFIGNIEGNSAEINGDESHHFTKVLRGKVGQEIQITDGKGKMGKGIVSQINSKSVEIDLNEVIENHEKRPYKIHIAIAPTKSMERMEFFMEKATEIGIDEISFLKTFHSERKNINLDRCRKILVSAVKQSLKVYVPQLNDLVKFNDFVKENHPENKLIAHCDEDFTRLNFKEFIQPQKDYLILIGPEGDFSKEEIELALQNGFTGISLGNQRLRTETAALNAIFAANWINN